MAFDTFGFAPIGISLEVVDPRGESLEDLDLESRGDSLW